MTEKRFYLDENGINDREYEFSVLGEDELVDIINAIVDENEQLKSEIEKLSYANEDLLSEKRNWQKMSDEYCKLLEENEQLKQLLLQFYTEDEINAELI